MITERPQALTCPITRFPDILLIKKSPAIGDSLSLGIDHAVETSSSRSWPDCPALRRCLRRRTDPGSHLRFVRKLDFGVLEGLGTRAAAEIRETEDALIAFIEAEQKRDALHWKTKHEIAAKYNQQDRLGGAA
jgi:hypothetical protein